MKLTPKQHRQSSHSRGYDRRWQKIRTMHLSEYPLCVECQKQGKLTAATVVDHITPHKGDWTLFNNPANHQSLCASCHSFKTAAEDGGFGNVKGQAKVRASCDIDGNPTDPRHHWKR